MDELDLRNAFLSAREEELDPVGKRRKEILDEARRIQTEFAKTADSAEKKRLQQEYEALDRELEDLKAKEAEAEKQREESRRRARRYEEAMSGSFATDNILDEQERVEKGRRRLLDKAKAGAGEATHTRIKQEIEYLLDNYLPKYEDRLNQLIDKWRRSGDPEYDPAINVRFRNTRRDFDNNQTAY